MSNAHEAEQDLPRIVASATMRIGERTIRLAKLDDVGGMGPMVVFVGEPVHDIFGGPDGEPFLLAYVQALDENGQAVDTFFAEECFQQMVFQAGRPSMGLRPKEVVYHYESRAIVHGLLNMVAEMAVS